MNPGRSNDATDHAEPSIGASDGTNGGGSGAGVPDAETALRVGDPGHAADIAADRAKLFPGHNPPDTDDQPAPNGT